MSIVKYESFLRWIREKEQGSAKKTSVRRPKVSEDIQKLVLRLHEVTGDVWLRGSYASPRYYTYGQGGNVYCQNGYVYVQGDRYATIPEYYNQAVRVVRSVPEITPEQAQDMEWKPLGVFALASDENQEASFIVQIAINQDGILSGTFYDEKSQETRPLLGRVDEGSQRAIWHFADDPQNGIVMETMLFNMSKDETTVLVHFGEETTESWLMVRIPEPEEN